MTTPECKYTRDKKFEIQTRHQFRGILFLWCYDLAKYWAFGDLMRSQGIDPALFLFFDMITVPPFIMGTARLVNSLTCDPATHKMLSLPRVTVWSAVVLFNTLLPYVYAAKAGASRFTFTAWVVFGLLILLVLANLVRTVWVQVRSAAWEKQISRYKIYCANKQRQMDK